MLGIEQSELKKVYLKTDLRANSWNKDFLSGLETQQMLLSRERN